MNDEAWVLMGASSWHRFFISQRTSKKACDPISQSRTLANI